MKYLEQIKEFKDLIQQYAKSRKTYSYSIDFQKNVHGQESPFINKSMDVERFDSNILELLQRHQPHSIRLTAWSGASHNVSALSEEEIIISGSSPIPVIPQSQPKPTTPTEDYVGLGQVESMINNKLALQQATHERELVEIRHQHALEAKDRKIENLVEENTNLKRDLKDLEEENIQLNNQEKEIQLGNVPVGNLLSGIAENGIMGVLKSGSGKKLIGTLGNLSAEQVDGIFDVEEPPAVSNQSSIQTVSAQPVEVEPQTEEEKQIKLAQDWVYQYAKSLGKEDLKMLITLLSSFQENPEMLGKIIEKFYPPKKDTDA